LSEFLDGYLELDVDVRGLCDPHDVGQLYCEAGGLVQVVHGEDLHARGADHHLSLVNVGALK
jgi:hypothetical protein